MIGIETDAALFYGVDLGFMQAQWRDCADKGKQMQIFRDMTGRKATVQEILDAVGDPTYCGPLAEAKRGYKRYTPEEDARILEMVAEGLSNSQIGDAFGVDASSINFRLTKLRKRGVEIPERKRGGAPRPKPVPVEIVGDPDPEGVPVPSVVSFTGLEQARQELDRLLAEEDSLRVRLQEVTAQIGAFRKSLSELLAMAGGGLDHA